MSTLLLSSTKSSTPLLKSNVPTRHISLKALRRAEWIKPVSPPPSGAAKLTNRQVIALHGVDSAKFLQGLTTNDILKDTRNGCFAAFLNAQGKVLNDAFIYPVANQQNLPSDLQTAENEPAFFIDVDKTTTDQLLQVFKRHKLRSKLKFHALNDGELDVWSMWREEDRWTAHGHSPGSEFSDISVQDTRAPGMGQRLLIPRDGTAEQVALGDIEQVQFSVYILRRWLHGVAEGAQEIPPGESLPMNHNLDLMGAIDFKKGCYSGQELTIRTHHTGVVRRRILPIAIYNKDNGVPDKVEYDYHAPIPGSAIVGADIKRDDKQKRTTGSVIAALGNIGLGMCRLEQMTDLVVSGEGTPFNPDETFFAIGTNGEKLSVKAFVPEWMRGKIRAPKLQRRVE
jgi:folate-binding protein YgfZ